MAATTCIVLVADSGHEVRIPSELLASASPVWSERLALAPPAPGTETKSVEHGVSQFSLDAFVGVLTLFTQHTTMPTLLQSGIFPRGSEPARLELQRLTAALQLVHKYDCSGARRLIAHLAEWHFPNATFPAPKRAGNYSPESSSEKVHPISQWLSQAHLDYILVAQELYPECPDMLNTTCLELLAHALSLGGIQWSRHCALRRQVSQTWHLTPPLFDLLCPQQAAPDSAMGTILCTNQS